MEQNQTPRTRWQDREHSSYVRTNRWAAGWEHDTAEQARTYVADQYSKLTAEDKRMAGFEFEIASNGLRACGFIGNYSAVVCTRTYQKGETMRELAHVVSPSDCTWMIPGLNED